MLQVAQPGAGRAGVLSDAGPGVSRETRRVLQGQGGSRLGSRWLTSQGTFWCPQAKGVPGTRGAPALSLALRQPGRMRTWCPGAGGRVGPLGRCPLAWGWTPFFKFATHPSGAAPLRALDMCSGQRCWIAPRGPQLPPVGQVLRRGACGGPRPAGVHSLLHILSCAEAVLSLSWSAWPAWACQQSPRPGALRTEAGAGVLPSAGDAAVPGTGDVAGPGFWGQRLSVFT